MAPRFTNEARTDGAEAGAAASKGDDGAAEAG